MMTIISNADDLKIVLLIAVLTGFTVEGLKSTKLGKKCATNILAVIVAIIITGVCCVSEAIFAGTAFDAILIWYIIDMGVLSSIISMIGYDKFMQGIAQITSLKTK